MGAAVTSAQEPDAPRNMWEMPRGARKAICTVSGGFDSAAALLWSMRQCPTVGVFVDSGQAYAEQERRAAIALAELACVAQNKNWFGLIELHIELSMINGTPWVPFRNLNIAAACSNVAAVMEAHVVVFGSKSKEHRPDDPISYLDSTVDFYAATQKLLQDFTGTERKDKVPQFVLPLLGWTKKEVLHYLLRNGVPLELLWNCYRTDGVPTPCGLCEHCIITRGEIDEVLAERRAAFYAGA